LKQENEILSYYAFRWKIACCFRSLKTNGFNLEEIHFKDQQKIDCIFAMASLAYIFASQEAIIDLEMTETTSVKAIPLKRYTNRSAIFKLSKS
jgi:transposase